MNRLARICFNSAGWRQPTGEACKLESGSYVHRNGFGHEEWLFRSEWLIAGWRYSFIQGVNDSYAVLVHAQQPFDLTLYTKLPNKKHRYVALIRDVECIDDRQAKEALEEFKRRGWFKEMCNEIENVSANLSMLGSQVFAYNILNIRYRLDNVKHFPATAIAQNGDPINRLPRYKLYNSPILAEKTIAHGKNGNAIPLDSLDFPSYWKSGSKPVECSPEHRRMQAKLMNELATEFPSALILQEHDFIDVQVRTQAKLILYEIKSDLSCRSVIRQALGQVLEYAYHPCRAHELPVELVIVGRCQLTLADSEYLQRLRSDFQLPVSYRVVSLDAE